MFTTVLVANRGEIALRVITTLRRMGVRAVAVASDADLDAPHVRAADEAVRLGPEDPADSYLSVDAIIAAARACGAQAIHPGYGFLSEHAGFAQACADAGIAFIGPPAGVIATMGDKIAAKRAAQAAGVPVVPGVHDPGMDDASLQAAADTVGFPLMVKAAAGGGGKGMRLVTEPAEIPAALAAARREARGAFDDDALLLERAVPTPRHVEVQVLADAHGACVHLGERECSLQRRHQKVVEEAPSPLLTPDERAAMGAAAVAVAEACGYVGAGTVEFLVSGVAPSDAGPREFWFLEMNTRLQVEHPVTEAVFGLDLVEAQVRVAAGEPLRLEQADLAADGHAVEARLYAEDPAAGFLPTGGRVAVLRWPDGPGIRVDAGIASGTVVGSRYDPLLAKLIAHGPDRRTALRRLEAALRRTVLLGVVTNLDLLVALAGDDQVAAGDLDTGLVERRLSQLVPSDPPAAVLIGAGVGLLAEAQRAATVAAARDPFAALGGWRVGAHAWTGTRLVTGDRVRVVRTRGPAEDAEVQLDDGPVLRARARCAEHGVELWVDGRRADLTLHREDGVVWVASAGHGTWALPVQAPAEALTGGQAAAMGPLTAPMPGTVAVVPSQVGARVSAGETLLVVEAMKMEHAIIAPHDGTVAALHVRPGQAIAMGAPLVEVAPDPDEEGVQVPA